MRSNVLVLAATVAAALLALSKAQCTYTPEGFDPTKVSYNLQYFSDQSPMLVYDERDWADPFNYMISICQNVNTRWVPNECVATRGRTSQNNCSKLSTRPSAGFQYFSSVATPTPSPSPPPSAQELQEPPTAAEGGFSLAGKGKVVRGALRDTIIAAARRGLKARPAHLTLRPELERIQAMTANTDLASPVAHPSPHPIKELTADGDTNCNSDRCWRVAGDATIPANVEFGPLFGVPGKTSKAHPDYTHMASGMTVSILGGDTCYDSGSDTTKPGVYTRALDVHLVCSPNYGSLDNEAAVVEVATCRYEVILHSVHACPSQCVPEASMDGADLCSYSGICGWDNSTQAARCFCFGNASGSQCTVAGSLGAPVATGHPDQVVGGLFGGLFGGLLIAWGVMYYITSSDGDACSCLSGLGGGGGGSSAPTSGTGGISAMFGGSSSSYAPPTPAGGDIPGIDDSGAGYEAPGGDDDDNPML